MKIKILPQSELTDLFYLPKKVFDVVEEQNGEVAIDPHDDGLLWYLKPHEYEVV